jgi:hypothetical protein
MNIKDVLVGSDPEVMVKSQKTQEIVSAIPLVKEGKDDPRDLGQGFKVLHDTTLIEFNIPPTDSKKRFIATMREGLKRVSKVIGKEHTLIAQASHEFPKKFLKERDANVFGCAASFDAWEMRMCQPPDCKNGLRTGSTHLHIGRKDFENPSDDVLINPYSKARIIRLMDLFLGIPFTILESNDPTNKARKKLYGTCGNHRPCEYGVEYRVLSNYCLRSPELLDLAFDLSMFAVRMEVEGKAEALIENAPKEKIIATINSASRSRAEKLLKALPMPDALKKRVYELDKQFEPSPLKAWGIK